MDTSTSSTDNNGAVDSGTTSSSGGQTSTTSTSTSAPTPPTAPPQSSSSTPPATPPATSTTNPPATNPPATTSSNPPAPTTPPTTTEPPKPKKKRAKKLSKLDRAGLAGAALDALQTSAARSVHEVLIGFVLAVEATTAALARAQVRLVGAQEHVKQVDADFVVMLASLSSMARLLAPQLASKLPTFSDFERLDPIAYSEVVAKVFLGDRKTRRFGLCIRRARIVRDEAHSGLKQGQQQAIDANQALKKANLELDRELKSVLVYLHDHQPKPTKPPRNKKAA